MCGIAGIWSIKKNTEAQVQDMNTMLQLLHHRGPDSQGIWSGHNGKLTLGHKRLSIQDLSMAGHQPMLSHDDRYVIVFNGEIYNFKSLRNRLKNNSYSFKGESDTEVILAAISCWGVLGSLDHLEGMFAFAVFDKGKNELWLARDRIGEKPLYYYLDEHNFMFSSELKPVVSSTSTKQPLDTNGLSEYFRYGYFPVDLTPFHTIRKLLPGSYLKIDENLFSQFRNTDVLSSHVKKYWLLPNSHNEILDKQNNDNHIIQQYESKLTQIIEEQLVADVDVGVFLSGGIDSTVVSTLASIVSNKQLKSFTVSFDHSSYDEATYAENISRHLKTDHHVFRLDSDTCLDTAIKMSGILDEPFGDSSCIPAYLISREAARHVKVCLSGDGGDELFAGYNRYHFGKSIDRLNKYTPHTLRKFVFGNNNITSFIKLISNRILTQRHIQGMTGIDKDIDTKIDKVFRCLCTGSSAELYLSLLTYWHESPLNHCASGQSATAELPDFSINFINSAMLYDLASYLPSDNLFKVDRTAMANSLEVRLPLLDPRMIEFTTSLDDTYKWRSSQRKWLLRQIIYKYMPAELVERPKMGFSVPLKDWLRKELYSWANSLLSRDILIETGLNSEVVNKYWKEHLTGNKDHANSIWTLLMYITWYKEYEDKIDYK